MTLGKRLNRVIIILFILTTLTYAAMMLLMQQQRIENTAGKISVFLEGIASNNSKSLANELFEKRHRAIKLRLESIANISGLSYAAVLNEQFNVISSVGNSTESQDFLHLERPAATNLITENTLTFIAPIQAYDELFGYLVMQYPLMDIQREELRNFIYFTLGFFLLMVITLLLVNTLTRRNIVTPINNLVRVMKDVQKGQFDRKIDITGSDEIQDLSHTFNAMTEEISVGYVRLKKASVFIEQIINAIDSILIAVDGDHKVTTWNSAASFYSNISRDDAVGKDLYAVFPILLDYRNDIEKSIEDSKPDFLHRTLINKTYFNIFIYPLKESDLQGVLIRLDDITQLEERENLLRQSQKMETVGLIAGGVAHDFNNMLSGILGAAQLLSVKNTNPDNTRYLEMIVNAGQRAADLTSKLLAFSRKSKLELRTFDCHEAINMAIDILRSSIDKNISIRTAFQASPSIIDGDLTELQNSFLNLGINASHAMPQGGEILFSTKNVELSDQAPVLSLFHLTPGRYIEIDIKDTGEGITSNDITSIFEPFFTTKGQGKGTGLGLAAVYGTVQQLRGAVTVDSEEGHGTIFHLFFPLSRSTPDKEEGGDIPLLTGQGTILVVDDEDVVRQTTKEILESWGYSVKIASNGKSALEIFKEQHTTIDVVILDMIMPEMSGVECFTAMKLIDPEIAVIISSGFNQDTDINQLKRMGIVGYLRKPCKQDELSRLVAQALHG